MNKNTVTRIVTTTAASALLFGGATLLAPSAFAADSTAPVAAVTLPATIDRSELTRPAPVEAVTLPATIDRSELTRPAEITPEPVTVPDIAEPEAGFQGIMAISLDITGEGEPAAEICDPSGEFACVVPLMLDITGAGEPAAEICDPSGEFACIVPLTDGAELGGILYADEDGNIVNPDPAPNSDEIDRSYLARYLSADGAASDLALVPIAVGGVLLIGSSALVVKKSRATNA